MQEGISNQKSSFSSNVFVNDLQARFLSQSSSDELIKLRNDNHNKFHKLDIEFVKRVDKRYLDMSKSIIDQYNTIDAKKLFYDNEQSANDNRKKIINLNNKINELKEEVRKDLMLVIDYVDKVEQRLDFTRVKKDNPLGIYILNKYQDLKLFSSKLDLKDLNFEMQHQSKRLIRIKELENLIKSYGNNKTIFNSDNTRILINNLYDIIGKYLHILTQSEFCYVKEAIKKIISFDYEYIETFISTYKIILNKIWNYSLENNNKPEFCYIVCDISLESDNIYVINNLNKDIYPDIGYICEIPRKFIINCDLDKLELISVPIPENIKEKYELRVPFDKQLINITGIYSKDHNKKFDSLLPIIYI